jgi:hypothetical protein
MRLNDGTRRAWRHRAFRGSHTNHVWKGGEASYQRAFFWGAGGERSVQWTDRWPERSHLNGVRAVTKILTIPSGQVTRDPASPRARRSEVATCEELNLFGLRAVVYPAGARSLDVWPVCSIRVGFDRGMQEPSAARYESDQQGEAEQGAFQQPPRRARGLDGKGLWGSRKSG